MELGNGSRRTSSGLELRGDRGRNGRGGFEEGQRDFHEAEDEEQQQQQKQKPEPKDPVETLVISTLLAGTTFLLMNDKTTASK